MADELVLQKGADTAQLYAQLLPQLHHLIEDEPDAVANLANIAAALKEAFDFWWVGFYLVRGQQLVLGPFQGPVACTRINFGKGVCGAAWAQGRTIVVPDVEQFPGHIACSSASRSEIVLPALHQGQVQLVLDADSQHLDHFDAAHQQGLAQVIKLVEGKLLPLRPHV